MNTHTNSNKVQWGIYALQMGLLILIIQDHITYLRNPFLKTYDIYQFKDSILYDYPYAFLDQLCEWSFVWSGIRDFPLLYGAVALSNFALLVLPPLLIFQRFWGIQSLVYWLITLASWKTMTYTFSLGIIFQYTFPILISLLLFVVLKQTLTPNVTRKGLWFCAILLLTAFGLYVTPRFVITIFVAIVWSVIFYIDTRAIKIDTQQLLRYLGLLAIPAIAIFIYALNTYANADVIINKYQHSPPTALIQQIFKNFSWAFVGIGPLLPLIIFGLNKPIWVPKKLLTSLSCLLIGICLFHTIYPQTLKELVYISYFVLLPILGALSFSVSQRRGPAFFLFLNFLLLYIVQSGLLMGHGPRNSVFVPYIFMAIAVLCPPDLTALRNAFRHPKAPGTNTLWVVMASITLFFLGSELMGLQKALRLQAQINQSNRTGWQRYVDTTSQYPNLNIASDKEVIYNTRDSFQELSRTFLNAQTTFLESPNDLGNYIPYYTYHHGPFLHRLFTENQSHIYIDLKQVANQIGQGKKHDFTHKLCWETQENLATAYMHSLPRGNYALIVSEKTPKPVLMVKNSKSEWHPLASQITGLESFLVLDFTLPNANTELKIQATRPISNAFLLQKANHLTLSPDDTAFAYQGFTDFFYSPEYIKEKQKHIIPNAYRYDREN